nr:isoprenyl transferase [Bacillus fonticola]
MIHKLGFKKRPPVQLEDRIKACLQHEVPKHMAIIMDGNGRWAKKRGLPRIAGHHEGMKMVRKATKLANRLGIDVLTLYAFSTENWTRPKPEVEYIMKLPEQFLTTYLPELVEENVKVDMMGTKDRLPFHTKVAIEKAMEDTKENNGLLLNFALNYGSRSELICAMQQMLRDHEQGVFNAHQVDEDTFRSYLLKPDLPDPDLLIRTSGEIRLSNFMLWQLAYTEFYFTDVLWPDFTEEHFVEAVEAYQKRSRRYGGVRNDGG